MLEPQRQGGRQRVAELMQAASEIIQERGFEAATMAEIAARADARIGSLYRFFPNKEAMAEALMRHYAEVLETEYATIIAGASGSSPEALGDVLIELFVRLHPQARALTALLDSRTDWTEIRLKLRAQALAGVKAALMACAPHLDERQADDIATVVLNNMKTMVAMVAGEAPTSPEAPRELRLMNRLYLAAKLGG